MRKLLFIIVAVLASVTCSAQKVISEENVMHTQTLKTTDLGNQKLVVGINAGDTAFALSLATGHKYRVQVTLGGTDDALRMLQFLLDYDAKSGDIIDLENASGNVAKWSGASGYTVYSEGKQFSGHLRKPNIKGFIKAIMEFSGRSE